MSSDSSHNNPSDMDPLDMDPLDMDLAGMDLPDSVPADRVPADGSPADIATLDQGESAFPIESVGGASASAGAAAPSTGRGKKSRKKKTKAAKQPKAARSGDGFWKSQNVYMGMLFLTLVFLAVASYLLYHELQVYGSYPWWKPPTQ